MLRQNVGGKTGVEKKRNREWSIRAWIKAGNMRR